MDTFNVFMFGLKKKKKKKKKRKKKKNMQAQDQ